MIRRQLLMATGVIAFVVLSACSDTTAPNQLAAPQGRHASEDDHANNQAVSARQAYATCAFTSVGAKENRAFAILGGGNVLFTDGTGSLGGVVSFDGRNMYAMNVTSWTGLDGNSDGTPEAFDIVGTFDPINFVGSTINWDLVFPVTGTPIDLDMNADGLNDFKVRCTLN
jgi:hypothetical protein